MSRCTQSGDRSPAYSATSTRSYAGGSASSPIEVLARLRTCLPGGANMPTITFLRGTSTPTRGSRFSLSSITTDSVATLADPGSRLRMLLPFAHGSLISSFHVLTTQNPQARAPVSPHSARDLRLPGRHIFGFHLKSQDEWLFSARGDIQILVTPEPACCRSTNFTCRSSRHRSDHVPRLVQTTRSNTNSSGT